MQYTLMMLPLEVERFGTQEHLMHRQNMWKVQRLKWIELINLCTKLTNINCQLQSAVIQSSPLSIMAALFESVTVKHHNTIIMVKSLLSL